MYFSDDIAKACESGSVEAVADAYIDLQQAYIPKRLVKRAAELQQQLRKTIIACLTKYANVNLFKAYQLFLWENNQHQHLVSAYEDMDIYRLDFYLPFYAKSLLDVIHRIPPQLLLKHQFYMTWVRHIYLMLYAHHGRYIQVMNPVILLTILSKPLSLSGN
ncbi:hypothetical protein Q8W16_21845 [Photobacterium damselae subsp. piscicida]|nr:hypothetical protein [Photobacterium damselae subsp. piscicida]